MNDFLYFRILCYFYFFRDFRNSFQFYYYTKPPVFEKGGGRATAFVSAEPPEIPKLRNTLVLISKTGVGERFGAWPHLNQAGVLIQKSML
jgi:hypothetical protein